MNIKICNRCKKPLNDKRFNVEFNLYGSSGILLDKADYNNENVQLNDFHLCTDCMQDFIEFVEEGSKQ